MHRLCKKSPILRRLQSQIVGQHFRHRSLIPLYDLRILRPFDTHRFTGGKGNGDGQWRGQWGH
jgi:hypothetical protein